MPDQASFTCPVCGKTSYNPNDVDEGYCGNCHFWTGGKMIPLVMRSCQECGKPIGCLLEAPPAITLGPRSCANHQ